jgi:hypothetical protein
MTIMRTWIVVLAAVALGGCQLHERATMYADTLTTDKDGFTNRSPQWAYEGEKVTFDFAPDLVAADYVVFTWPGDKIDVLSRQQTVNTYFRGIGVFKAGREPRRSIIRAIAYTVRGQTDWYYDKESATWQFHPPGSDPHDIAAGEAEMEIICYRVTIEMTFKAGRREMADAVLRIVRDDGSKTELRNAAKALGKGFELRGPGADGKHHVRYTPTHDEVNRTGKTDVELLLTYTDGTQETLSETIDTP